MFIQVKFAFTETWERYLNFPGNSQLAQGVFLQAEGVKFLLPPEVSGREGWGA